MIEERFKNSELSSFQQYYQIWNMGTAPGEESWIFGSCLYFTVFGLQHDGKTEPDD